ncbi:hypothetical protein [Methanolobus sp. WCC5]|uniref:hypothetical protein n=1 Tax=Methanolobus sp. WCC5 TaxID=3125785 RepID=UPI0032505EA9
MNCEYQSSSPTTCTLPSNTNSISKQISRETLTMSLRTLLFGHFANDCLELHAVERGRCKV